MAYPVMLEWLEQRKPVAVAGPAELIRHLDRIAWQSEPDHPNLAMIHNEGGTLTIGLGASVSTLNHIPLTEDSPYLICLGDAGAEGVIDFYLTGHHTQFLMRNTIPNELARRAVLEYAETGRLPASVAWEEV